ncbi:Hypp8454 [Branchiostoma lanceolatum]|uniref:Hypp8454 protein n=1 Tax=Branchiostoma lanceolatum TaxID=7740 RepID=A0A8J9Z6S5_BRALA|nr:Hypp8454 [Branchiostoma lanceolatum]
MNVQVALGLTKVPVGHSGLNTLFCSVELAGPAQSSLQSLATGLSGPVVALAQQALADNRGRLRQVLQLRGNLVEDGKPLAIAAAARGCYNNPYYKGFHQKSTQRPSVFRTDLSSQLVSGKVEFSGKVAQETTKAFCTVFSKAIGSRCSGELKRARGHHPTDGSKYLKSVSDAKNNILDCFSGNHTKCSALSFVCPCAPVASDHVPSYLPRKKYLLLTEEDRLELNEVLDFTMSEAAAMKQRYLRSTNSVEAMHRCVHKSLPKSLNLKALAEMRASLEGCGWDGGITSPSRTAATTGKLAVVVEKTEKEIFYNALDEEDILYFDALSLMISKTDLGSSLRGQRGLSLNHVPNLGDYINMKPLDGAEEKLIGASTKDSIKLFTLQTIRHRENAGIVVEEGRLEQYKPTPTLGT